jgi:thymidylate synthase (FAD)
MNDRVQVLDLGHVEMVDMMGGDAAVLRAARICYQSESKGPEADARLIERLLRTGHGTPFEQAVFTFGVKCPLFVARQWLRHRIGCSYNEKSLRYCTASREYYIPDRPNTVEGVEYPEDKQLMMSSDYPTAVYIRHCEDAFDTYELLVKRGWPKERARMVLPLSTYTEFVWTVNARALTHWLDLRTAPGAQAEHREYALVIGALWAEAMPVTAMAYFGAQERAEIPARKEEKAA